MCIWVLFFYYSWPIVLFVRIYLGNWFFVLFLMTFKGISDEVFILMDKGMKRDESQVSQPCHHPHNLWAIVIMENMFIFNLSRELSVALSYPCWTFTPMFSSNSFIVLSLTFRSLIHSELIFVHGVKWGCGSIFFAFGYPIVPTPLVKEKSLSAMEWPWHPC